MPVKKFTGGCSMNVNVCLDNERFYNKKSAGKASKKISNRIAGYEVKIPLINLVYEVGQCGRSFTPAVFKANRKVSDFKGMQVFCLDFDKGELMLQDILNRCASVHLPVVFAYDTFSSTEEKRKYRIGFVHIEPITNVDVASFILRILLELFPEADKNCRDTARMFFGGINVAYYDVNEPTFVVDELAEQY